MASPETKSQAAPVALVFVRNAVSFDARVLRAGRVLQDEGFTTTVIGVVAQGETRRASLEAGVEVVRLQPLSVLARIRRRVIAGPRAQAAGSEATSGVGAARVGDLPWPLRTLNRFLTSCDWYRLGIREVLRRRPAVVHCNDYNTMWIGVAARVLGSRVVYDSHELWPDRNGRPEPRGWLIACEALFVRIAHSVVTTSPGYADVISLRYGVRRPILVRNVPDWADAAPVSMRQPQTAVYVGGLLRGRGLEQSIKALATVPDLRLVAVGPGSESVRTDFMELARDSGVLDRVDVLAAIPHAQLVDLIRGAAFGIVLIQPICLSYELTLPNKLLEYTAAGVPSLGSDLPVIADFIRTNKIGEVVSPTDEDEIARGMRKLLAPEVNAGYRDEAARVAEALTWRRESTALARAYKPAP